MENKINEINGNIEVAFARLIGPLCIMSKIESFKKIKEELDELVAIISKWGAKFQYEKDLNFIDRDELLNVYNRMDKIKENYLYNPNIGDESELSDEIVIWMLELMNLRKELIDIKGGK